MSFKMSGKFAYIVELPEAIAQFQCDWMPHCTPEQWPSAWEDYKEGLHDTGWITDWQFRHWPFPKALAA